MKLNITIKMDNAAFEELNGIEAARILRELADRIDETNISGERIPIFDINGNRVGEANVTGK